MKKSNLFMLLLPLLFSIQQPTTGLADLLPVEAGGKTATLAAEERNPVPTLVVPFIENRGQLDARVKYYAKIFSGTVFITGEGVLVYDLPAENKQRRQSIYSGVAIYESLVDADISRVQGQGQAAVQVSRYIGPDPARWGKNLPTYTKINLGDVYDGIAMEVSVHDNTIEKTFRVKPSADYRQIRLRMDGINELRFNEKGQLQLHTVLGEVLFSTPIAYQETVEDGLYKRDYVDIAYLVDGKEYSFAVGQYDRSKELIIDPMISSSYLGGAGDDNGHQIGMDGAILVVGITSSDDFPATPGAYQVTSKKAGDVYIAKFSDDLQQLLAATYLGDSGLDTANSIAVDKLGNIYVAGLTTSPQFPGTAGPLANHGGYDIFVSKLDNDLQSLLASQLIGGSLDEKTYFVGLDQNGDVIVAGESNSTDISLPASVCGFSSAPQGNIDMFLVKLSSALNILAATFFGGSNEENSLGLTCDSNNDYYIVGTTLSSDIPGTLGRYSPAFNGGTTDAVIASFSSDLKTLRMATYLGGSQNDYGQSIVWEYTDRGYVLVTGNTYSSDFPADANYMRTTEDVYVTKLTDDLKTRRKTSFIAGSKQEVVSFMSKSAAGDVYLAGYTDSENLPTTADAYSPNYNGGDYDGFVAKFDSDLNLDILTYLGGSKSDAANAAVLHVSGHIFITGNTVSPDFPQGINPGYDNSYAGGVDAFVVRLDSKLSDNNSGLTQYTVNITISPDNLGGQVSSIPAGLTCTTNCSQVVDELTVLKLKITAPAGYQTVASGCSGVLDHDVFTTGLVNQNCTVKITFDDGSGGGATYRFPYEMIRGAIDHAGAQRQQQAKP